MIQLLRTLIVTSVSRHRNYLKMRIPQLLYGTNNGKPTSEEELKVLLHAKFPEAKIIEVTDASGGCGAMYNIYVETKDFKGISIAKQHQAVYAALYEKIKLIHGIHVVTKAPP